MNAASLPVSVPVTEFARGMSDYLNQVQYLGQVIEISRGKKVVAKVVPSVVERGMPIAQFDGWLAQRPRLDAEDASDWLEDLSEMRQRQREPVRDAWGDH